MYHPQRTIIVLFLVSISYVPIFAQEPGQSILINNPDDETVYYCGSPVAVTPGILIENYDVAKTTDGIKISITNYVPGEDTLFYAGSEFDSNWDNQLGNLELTGLGTSQQLEQAVRQVYYVNKLEDPNSALRSISVSLIDADYLPETDHFYKYIVSPDILWTEAKAIADTMYYHNLRGYLVTITSDIENDFIWSKIEGVGWIGATDAGSEGTWRWDTGPEAGTIFWEGGSSGQPVDNNYSNWAAGEPNNLGPEHYAHINQDTNLVAKSWNDMEIGGDSVPGSFYRVQGFIVEFGGSTDDPDVQLSASAVIAVNTRRDALLVEYDSIVCGNLQQKLNIQAHQGVAVVTQSIDPNASVLEETSVNPTVMVQKPGEYWFVVESTSENNCIWSDTIVISFRDNPDVQLNITEAECINSDLLLFSVGDVGNDAFYEWYSVDTIFNSDVNLDSLVIPLESFMTNRAVGLRITENSCTDSVEIPLTVKPRVIIQADRLEGCIPLEVEFSYTSNEPIQQQLWKIGPESTSSDETPSFTFGGDGLGESSFDVSLSVISAEGCASGDTIENMIRIHPNPTVDLSFDESVCHAGNEEIWYSGNAGPRDTFLWDLSGIPPGEVVKNPGRTEGPLQLNLTGSPFANIGLQVVSEFGCKSDTVVKTFTRKPSIDVASDTIGGCPPFEVELMISTDDFVDQVDYLWDFGNGHAAGGSSVSQVYTGENQSYDVSVYGISSLTGCADTLVLPGKVVVFPVPEASFTAEPVSVLATDPEITFNNTSSGAMRYEWNFGDNTFGSTAENPVHEFESLGLFDVTLLAVNDFGCRDSAFAQVSVTFDKLFPPNAFSPNAIREEDREFRIYAEGIVNEGYNLLIFNRWGEVVFTSRTPEEGWDGKMKNGSNAPPGTYFWVLEYLDLLGKEHLQKGSLTLLY